MSSLVVIQKAGELLFLCNNELALCFSYPELVTLTDLDTQQSYLVMCLLAQWTRITQL